jgi:uncharacterized protein YeaO (DUF488 family)
MKQLKIKRVYDDIETSDGLRILVDRLWPRGITREQARIDYWVKEVSPSSELRKWYNHDINKWKTFRSRYFDELSKQSDSLTLLRKLIDAHDVTLLYSARMESHNNAVALVEYLLRESNAHEQG